MRTRLVASALTMLSAVALTLALGAGPAEAHVSLVGSSPEQGGLLSEPPDEVRLDFSSELSSPATVVVTAPGGTIVTNAPPTVSGHTVRQPLAGGGDGSWAVAYRAVSVDGHEVTGRITFSVGDHPAPPSVAPGSAGAQTPASVPGESGVAAVDPQSGGPVPSAAKAGSSRRDGLAAGVGALLLAAAALLWMLSRRAEGPTTTG